MQCSAIGRLYWGVAQGSILRRLHGVTKALLIRRVNLQWMRHVSSRETLVPARNTMSNELFSIVHNNLVGTWTDSHQHKELLDILSTCLYDTCFLTYLYHVCFRNACFLTCLSLSCNVLQLVLTYLCVLRNVLLN